MTQFGPSTRTLYVYVKDSHYSYSSFGVVHLYEIDSNNTLSVINRSIVNGDENVVAAFRTWDYFLVE